jgi:glucose-6-phosphate 1-epimerase
MPAHLENDKVELTHGESQVTIYHFGASLTSWKYRGIERIFTSQKANYSGPKAIRGGIPLVFPQFGPKGPLPQHGFARVSKWTWLGVQTENEGELTVEFGLKPDQIPESQRAIWSHDFYLVYTVSLRANTLFTQLSVKNTSTAAFDFTTLLHTYIRVEDVTKVGVNGLTGYMLVDSLEHDKRSREARSLVTVQGEVDRVYENVPSVLTVENTRIGNGFVIVKNNFNDTVVWNPWIENAKKMADFGDEEYMNMICVEVGNVAQPIHLPAGQTWTGSQTLVAL